MSRFDDNDRAAATRGALESMESAVTRALERIDSLENAVRSADERRREVEELLERMSSGEESPVEMQARIQTLAAENADLRRRLDEGLEGVERLLAKIRFLEEQRRHD